MITIAVFTPGSSNRCGQLFGKYAKAHCLNARSGISSVCNCYDSCTYFSVSVHMAVWMMPASRASMENQSSNENFDGRNARCPYKRVLEDHDLSHVIMPSRTFKLPDISLEESPSRITVAMVRPTEAIYRVERFQMKLEPASFFVRPTARWLRWSSVCQARSGCRC